MWHSASNATNRMYSTSVKSFRFFKQVITCFYFFFTGLEIQLCLLCRSFVDYYFFSVDSMHFFYHSCLKCVKVIQIKPVINEFRGTRSVQLNLVDIRPDRDSREQYCNDRQIYDRFVQNQWLAGWEASLLLPERCDFTAVWRYLVANVQEQQLVEDLSCLSRKIARYAGAPCSPGRLQICLDVFRERGLLSLKTAHGRIRILLANRSGKVDLDQSPIIIKLKQQKAGE